MGIAPWIRIRKELYQHLERHVRLLLGEEPPDLRRYRQDFEADVAGTWRASTRHDLFAEIEKVDLVFLADFHALAQSQRSHLRILKGVSKKRPLALAVEFFEARHQKFVDEFLSGDLAEREFLAAIDWTQSWGFPWDHYRPLVRYAQKHQIPILALNRRFSERTGRSLRQRDQFAADRILMWRKKNPLHRLFVVYGDMHLAEKHLPKQVSGRSGRMRPRQLTVFQNNERIYFQLLKKELDLDVDVVRLSQGAFCLLSVPPWVKWQNYLMFLERHLDRELQGDHLEYTDHIMRYVRVIAADLGVEVEEGSFSIYTAEDEVFWEQLQNTFRSRDLGQMKEMLLQGKSFFVPELQAGFLARPSVNHAAQLAMSVVHAQLSGWKGLPTANLDGFLRLIWLEAVQYFGSKLINPRRKTDTIQDLRVALASRSPADQGEEAMKLALQQKMREMLFLAGQAHLPTVLPSVRRQHRQTSYREAARLLGGMLGEKLFTGFRCRLIKAPALVRLLRHPVNDPGFSRFYYELLEVVEGLPEPFLSKVEKM